VGICEIFRKFKNRSSTLKYWELLHYLIMTCLQLWRNWVAKWTLCTHHSRLQGGAITLSLLAAISDARSAWTCQPTRKQSHHTCWWAIINITVISLFSDALEIDLYETRGWIHMENWIFLKISPPFPEINLLLHRFMDFIFKKYEYRNPSLICIKHHYVLDLESSYFDSEYLILVLLLTCSTSRLLLLWINGT